MYLVLAILVGLAAAQCPSNDIYCGRCYGNMCFTCHASAFNGTACVAPATTVDNCQSYNITGGCSLCMTGYYLDANKKCVKITEANCYAYNLVNKCTACNDKIRSVNGTCTDNTKKCADENCSICDSINACLVCNTGFIFDKNKKCIAGTGIANCKDFGPVACNSCDYGYYFGANSTCVSGGYVKSAYIFSSIVAALSALLIYS